MEGEYVSQSKNSLKKNLLSKSSIISLCWVIVSVFLTVFLPLYLLMDMSQQESKDSRTHFDSNMQK